MNERQPPARPEASIALHRYRQSTQCEQYEAQAAYYAHLAFIKARQADDELAKAERNNDLPAAARARRTADTATERLEKQSAIQTIFREAHVSRMNDVRSTLLKTLQQQEARLQRLKESDPERDKAFTKIEALTDALSLITTPTNMTDMKPFVDWLPSWYAHYPLPVPSTPESPPISVSARTAEPIARAMEAYADSPERPKVTPEQHERAELIEQIINHGAFHVSTSLASSDQLSHSGFQEIVDPRWKKKAPFLSEDGGANFLAKPLRLIFEGQPGGGNTNRELLAHGISELVVLRPLFESKTKKEERTVEKSGALGFFGVTEKRMETIRYDEAVKDLSTRLPGHESHEPGVILAYETTNSNYTDYTGRTGNFLRVSMVLPQSIGLRALALGKKDPTFFRELAKKSCIERTGAITPEMWETGKGNGDPSIADNAAYRRIRPPYEQWKSALGGEEKMYIQDRTSTQGVDQTFKIQEVYTINTSPK